MARDRSCEARIGEHMESRLADIRGLVTADPETLKDYGYEVADEIEALDRAMDAIAELPLSIEVVRSVRIVFSTGGPHDEVVIEVDQDGRAVRGEYVFQDWFDGARRSLSGDDLEVIEQAYGYVFNDLYVNQDARRGF